MTVPPSPSLPEQISALQRQVEAVSQQLSALVERAKVACPGRPQESLCLAELREGFLLPGTPIYYNGQVYLLTREHMGFVDAYAPDHGFYSGPRGAFWLDLTEGREGKVDGKTMAALALVKDHDCARGVSWGVFHHSHHAKLAISVMNGRASLDVPLPFVDMTASAAFVYALKQIGGTP